MARKKQSPIAEEARKAADGRIKNPISAGSQAKINRDVTVKIKRLGP